MDTSPLRDLAQLSAGQAKALRLVCCDIDGTLTRDGRLSALTLEAFALLAEAGLLVLPATGRSAATGYDLALYLPHVAGVVCENGALFFDAHRPGRPRYLHPGLRDQAHRRGLETAYARLRTAWPNLRRTDDDLFRLTEVAMVREAWMTDPDIRDMDEAVRQQGLGFTYSTVHLHIQGREVTKWAMVAALCPDLGVDDPFTQVLTIGDSANDITLFDHRHVAASVGVSRVGRCREEFGGVLPAFLCHKDAAEGFMEMAVALSVLRRESAGS